MLAAIGGTPLVELSRVTKDLNGRVLAKLEYLNPGGSKKDRIALRMIEDAEASGELRSGQTVVELTSGNTGTGLAIVCAVKGYPFVAVMSAGIGERPQMRRARPRVPRGKQRRPRGHVTGATSPRGGRIASADERGLSGRSVSPRRQRDSHEDTTAAEMSTSGGTSRSFAIRRTGGPSRDRAP